MTRVNLLVDRRGVDEELSDRAIQRAFVGGKFLQVLDAPAYEGVKVVT